MKFKKLSLRLRLTFINGIILILMCIILTLGANISAQQLTKAAETTTPIEIGVNIGNNQQHFATQNAREDFQKETINSMVIIIIVGTAITFYFSGKALKPLEDLSKEVSNINVNNLSEKIKVPQTSNEVITLTKSFNDMTEEIHRSYVMQKHFSANVAHELRTPLTVLQTKIDVFRKNEDRTVKEYKELVNTISNNTERLSAVVKDLLELTNEEDVPLNESVFIREVVEEISLELEGIAKEKNISIEVIGDEAIISGNDRLLQRAFYNLIENAIKYNMNNGKVIIAINKEEDNVLVTVADTGHGIPDKLKYNIFEPFFRVDKSRSRDIGGSGLGLAIVKNIIDKHHGAIKVENNVPQGTYFKISLRNET